VTLNGRDSGDVSTGRIEQQRILRVEGDDAVDIPCVRPLEEEPAYRN